MVSRQELKVQKEKISEAIIEAALQLAADTGYASLSLRSVARKAGIAPTSFYRHFRDIDEMGAAIIEKAVGVLESCMAQAVDIMQVYSMADLSTMKLEQSIRQVLVTPFTDRMLACMEDHSQLLSLFFQERTGNSPALREGAHKGMERLTDMLCVPLKTFFEKVGAPDTAGSEDDSNGEDAEARIRWTAGAMISMVAAGAIESIFLPDRNRETLKRPLAGKLNYLILGAVTSQNLRREKNS